MKKYILGFLLGVLISSYISFKVSEEIYFHACRNELIKYNYGIINKGVNYATEGEYKKSLGLIEYLKDFSDSAENCSSVSGVDIFMGGFSTLLSGDKDLNEYKTRLKKDVEYLKKINKTE
ncbi:hypothetical protein [Comamonas sp.]|uniref:hypothetical protein n=1 Tax=Comamonas sp. TaxID=34028 RepID=UPI0028998BA3|nr:hypothetical protein [Comamonas sp.]